MKPVLQVRSLAVSVVIPSGMKILGFPPRYRLTIVNPMLAASLIRSPVPLRVPGTRVVSEPSAPEEDERSIVRTSGEPDERGHEARHVGTPVAPDVPGQAGQVRRRGGSTRVLEVEARAERVAVVVLVGQVATDHVSGRRERRHSWTLSDSIRFGYAQSDVPRVGERCLPGDLLGLSAPGRPLQATLGDPRDLAEQLLQVLLGSVVAHFTGDASGDPQGAVRSP